jgi:hypothetical protein
MTTASLTSSEQQEDTGFEYSAVVATVPVSAFDIHNLVWPVVSKRDIHKFIQCFCGSDGADKTAQDPCRPSREGILSPELQETPSLPRVFHAFRLFSMPFSAPVDLGAV